MEIIPKHEGTRGFVYIHVHIYSITTCFSMVREFIYIGHLHMYFPLSLYIITLVSHTCIVKEIIKFRELSQLL